MDRNSLLWFAPILLAPGLISCGSSNPNIGRVLTSIAITPQKADALNSASGQVVFTATGTFSLPPLTAPLNFTPPYAGQFVVNNPAGTIIAAVVATGTGTITVQCASGAAGTVFVTASAFANNGTPSVITGSAQLTCP
jgi:hypothetical protein